ncbi:MAG: FAD:protein FMN transferase [Buchnera aphidicola (Kaburagia rhusicola rhusicola)]
MGTTWQINLINTYSNEKKLIKEINQQVYYDNKELSFWEKNSKILKFNNYHGTKPQRISKNFAKIMLTALLVGKKTSYALDVTIGKLVNIWGFGPKKPPKNIPKSKTIKNALLSTGLKNIQLIKKNKKYYLKKNIKKITLDFSTLGEGFIADHLRELLITKGIKDFVISVGGAITTHSKNNFSNPKIIAIQKPTDEKINIHMIVKLYNHAISTSGTYRNYYYLKGKKIVHLLDPTTGYPTKTDLVSVSVITKSALESDAWDTGLMILGFEKAKQLAIKEKLAVCLIKEHRSKLFTWISPQFHFFLKKDF